MVNFSMQIDLYQWLLELGLQIEDARNNVVEEMN